MRQETERLWVEALLGHGGAYRKLGIIYLSGGRRGRAPRLARLCLEKSMELGDSVGFFIYHRIFSKGKEVIDDLSYLSMYKEYRNTPAGRRKKQSRRYLMLGTKRQIQLCRAKFGRESF